MNPTTVLFFGAQGSGKGTQVKLLMEALKQRSGRGIIHIDMGAELRAQIARGGFTAPLVNEVLSNGKRMPDFMPIFLQTKLVVENLTGDEHIIADGLARGADQTRAFDDMMQFYNRANYKIIVLQLSEDESVKRLLARGRSDDTEAAIRNRLAWNKTDVEPQLEMLRERGREIIPINGERSMEEIHADIMAKLGIA